MPGAITPVSVTTFSSASSATSYQVATAVTLVANRPYLLQVTNGGTGTNSALVPTAVTSTTGHTWVLLDSIAHSTVPNRRVSLYQANGVASPTAGSITVPFSVAQGYCLAELFALQGGLTTSPVVQFDSDESANVKVGTWSAPDLAAIANANNIKMAFWSSNTFCSFVADGGTRLAQTQLASGKNTTAAVTWFDGDVDLAVDVWDDTESATSTTKVAVIVVEVAAEAAAGGGGGGTAPVVSHIWTDSSSGALTAYTLDGGSAFTPAAAAGYLLVVDNAVSSGTPTAATITNGTTGLSFSLVGSVQFGTAPIRLVSLYASPPAGTPASGSLTATFSATQSYCLANLYKVVDPGTDGSYGTSGLVGQFASTDSDPNLVGTLALGVANPLGTNSVGFASFSASLNGQLTPTDVGWTELVDTTIAGGKNITQAGQWRNDDDDQATGVNVFDLFAVAATAKVAGIVVELVAGASGATDTADFSDSFTWTDSGLDDVFVALTDTWPFTDSLHVAVTTPPPSEPPPPPGVSRPASAVPKVDLIVEVRDVSLAKVGQVIDMRTVQLVLRYQDVSNMVMVLPDNSTMAWYLTQPGAGVVVRREGTVIFSGPVQWKRFTEEGVRWLQVWGPDDTKLLRDRIAYPDPTTDMQPAQTIGWDVRTGPGETLIYEYVNANLGPDALPDRQVPLVFGVDMGRGESTAEGGSITERGRGETLLELSKRIAAATALGLGFPIRQIGTDLVFEVFQPEDRSGDVVFSEEMGNLASWSLESDAPLATHVVVAGQGEAELRAFAERTASGLLPSWGRVEQFKDRRDVDDFTELGQAADVALSEARPKLLVTLEPVDTPRLHFGRDYYLGDVVTVIIPGQGGPGASSSTYAAGGDGDYGDLFHGDTYSSFGTRPTRPVPIAVVDVVRQVTLTYADATELIEIVVGTDTSEPLDIYLQQRTTAAAVNHLNRR